MKVINYNPEQIKKDFKLLKNEIDDYNEIEERIHKKHILWIVIATLFFAMISTLFIILTCTKTLSMILGVVLSVIFVGITCVLIFNLIVGVDCGADIKHISKEMTFAMKFWKTCDTFNLLKIECSEDNLMLIEIHKEDKNHFVKKETICAHKVVNSTDVTEITLDVAQGYVLVPYKAQEKPVFE